MPFGGAHVGQGVTRRGGGAPARDSVITAREGSAGSEWESLAARTGANGPRTC